MKYKNPGSTSDIIVEREDKILLVKRRRKPYRGKWAIPGGFINYGKETLERTAQRELAEETGLYVRIKDLGLIGVFSHPKRDPRYHIIAHVYKAKRFMGKVKAGDDAKNAKWFSFYELPKKLAFDHTKIINYYLLWGKKSRILKLK